LGAGERARAWAPARARAPASNECNELETGALGRAMMQNSTSNPSKALGRQPRRGRCPCNQMYNVVQRFTKHCN